MLEITPNLQLPGKVGIPLLGEALPMFRDRRLFYWKRFQAYGSVFKTQVFGRSVAVLVGPAANQFVLKEGAHHFSSRQGWALLEPLLGDGILLQDGASHHALRRLMYPAFHETAIAPNLSRIYQMVKQEMQSWQLEQSFELFPAMRSLSLQAACELTLGIQHPQLSQNIAQLEQGQRAILRRNIPGTRFGCAIAARHNLEKFLQTLICQPPQSHSILRRLMEATDDTGHRLSNDQLITQALQILLAGFEPTAKLLGWCIVELSRNPDWIDRLRTEAKALSTATAPTLAQLRSLTALDWVLQEVERLHPPFYVIPRGVIQPFEFGGYSIPAGWSVAISPFLTHRLRSLYRHPHQFDPERFSPHRAEHKQHPYALIGFGGGMHACLGKELARLELKMILILLLQQFNWQVELPCKSNYSPINVDGVVVELLNLKESQIQWVLSQPA